MAASEIKNNLIPSEPSLKDLLDLLKKDILLNFNCHHIATIQTFNPLNQTVTATINYKKTFFQPDLAGVYQPVLVDYPILIDCPAIVLGGGAGALTIPIQAGDECIVLFNDRDIDNWFAGNSSGPNATPRLHSFSDGLVLVGVRSLANVIPVYSEDAIELRTKDGLTKVAVAIDGSKVTTQVGPAMTLEVNSDGTIKILNASGFDFVAALVKLFEDIQAGTVLGVPLSMPTFATDLAVLESYEP